MSHDTAEVITVELSSLIATSGVGYAPAAEDLAGRRIEVEGPIFRDRFGAIGIGTLSPGCSHGGSEIGIVICDPPLALTLIATGTLIRVRGVIDYGFTIDERGTATYLRLRDPSIASGSDTP